MSVSRVFIIVIVFASLLSSLLFVFLPWYALFLLSLMSCHVVVSCRRRCRRRRGRLVSCIQMHAHEHHARTHTHIHTHNAHAHPKSRESEVESQETRVDAEGRKEMNEQQTIGRSNEQCMTRTRKTKQTKRTTNRNEMKREEQEQEDSRKTWIHNVQQRDIAN